MSYGDGLGWFRTNWDSARRRRMLQENVCYMQKKGREKGGEEREKKGYEKEKKRVKKKKNTVAMRRRLAW